MASDVYETPQRATTPSSLRGGVKRRRGNLFNYICRLDLTLNRLPRRHFVAPRNEDFGDRLPINYTKYSIKV